MFLDIDFIIFSTECPRGLSQHIQLMKKYKTVHEKLKEQRIECKEYKDTADKLRYELADIQLRNGELTAYISKLGDDIARKDVDYAKCSEKCESMRRDLTDYESRMIEMQLEHTFELRELREEKDLKSREKVDKLREKADKLRQTELEMMRFHSKYDVMERKYKKSVESMESLKSVIDSKEERIAILNAKIAEITEVSKDGNRRCQELQKVVDRLKTEVDSCNAKMGQLNVQKAMVDMGYQRMMDEVENYKLSAH